jgi:hypothetical protein
MRCLITMRLGSKQAVVQKKSIWNGTPANPALILSVHNIADEVHAFCLVKNL